MYATSGFKEFDYIIGDRLVVRNDEMRFYTERCLQLPLSYLTFQTNHSAPP
jgi:predicted O-linked N-acetylglucosamine transferase (SPINDLY family)